MMANRTNYVTTRPRPIGDVAVDGLLAGMAAGAAMAAYLIVVGLVTGAGVGPTLARFDPGSEASPLVGALLHLAVAGIYGVVFALGYRLLARRWASVAGYGWAAGLAYGLALWALAQSVLLPGMNSRLAALAPLHFAVGHALYGLALGYLVGRHQGAS